MPATALGSARAKPFTPNNAAEIACTQNPSGGLSTVTEPPGSNDPKKKFEGEVSIDLTVAA